MTFRQWLHEMWLRNCEERSSWKMTTYSIQQYIVEHKWWLRRQYRHQQGQQQ